MNHEELDKFILCYNEKLSEKGKHDKITLIGGCAMMLHGIEDRETQDIDLWIEDSKITPSVLKEVCEEMDILFNPTSEVYSSDVFLQIISKGIVQLGEKKDTNESHVLTLSNLEVDFVPIPNLIISKLIRGNGRDINDVNKLIEIVHERGVKKEELLLDITRNSKKCAKFVKEKIEENTIYVSLKYRELNNLEKEL